MPKIRDKSRLRKARSAFRSQAWAMLPDAFLDLHATLFPPNGKHIASLLQGDDDEADCCYVTHGNVAQIDVQGTAVKRADWFLKAYGMVGYEQIAQAIQQAEADPAISSIVLNIDSPGGSVLGVRELASAIRSSSKPVYAVANGMAASAAYYLGSAASKLFGSPASMVGSIGTYWMHTDVSKMRSEFGIKDTLVSAGENKASDHPYFPLSERGKDNMQEVVNSYYRQFVADVATHRNMAESDVEDRFGQGKVYTSEDAPPGMLDGVATLQQVIQMAAALHPQAKPVNAARPAGRVVNQEEGRRTVSNVSKGLRMPKILAQLYVMGLIDSVDVPEAVWRAALNAYFQGSGQAMPEGDEAILASLQSPRITASAIERVATPLVNTAEERSRILSEDADRRAQIEAIARGLNVPLDSAIVAQSLADHACTPTSAHAAMLRAQAEQRRPVNVGPERPTGIESLHADCLAGLGHAVARANSRTTNGTLSESQSRISRMPLAAMARMYLHANGVRVDESTPPEQVARWALGLGNYDVQREIQAAGGGSGSYNHPTSFPLLFSSVMNRELDANLDLADVSYDQWAFRETDAIDMRPTTTIQLGGLGEFSAVQDGEDSEEDTYGEEGMWIVPDFFRKSFKLTPLMIANNDLGAFANVAADYAQQWRRTINRQCLLVLVNNMPAYDGTALIHTNHKNLRNPGAAFSLSEFTAMRGLFRQQVGIAKLNGVAQRVSFGNDFFVLAGANHETAIEQTLDPLDTYPVSEGTVNVMRRRRIPYAIDTMLDEYEASANAGYRPWFVLSTRRPFRAVRYKFQGGYENLNRTEEYVPRNGCMMYHFEGRMGVQVGNYRGVARNDGT